MPSLCDNTPDHLWKTTGRGRESVIQRSLSTLVFGHTAFGWNAPGTPSDTGQAFIQQLLDVCFGERLPDGAQFVEELELRDADGKGRVGWPDLAVIGDGLLLLIELKTDVRSHRHGQLDDYLQLAADRHPDRQRLLLYVTPPMDEPSAPNLPDRSRFCHTTWAPISTAIQDCWGASSDPCEREIATQLDRWLGDIEAGGGPPPRERAIMEESFVETLINLVLRDAAEVERTREQKAIDLWLGEPELLDMLRRMVTERINQEIKVEGVAIEHVQPWLWSATTTGTRPRSTTGETFGYELRLSYSPGKTE